MEHYIKLLTIVIWRFKIFWSSDILFWTDNLLREIWDNNIYVID